MSIFHTLFCCLSLFGSHPNEPWSQFSSYNQAKLYIINNYNQSFQPQKNFFEENITELQKQQWLNTLHMIEKYIQNSLKYTQGHQKQTLFKILKNCIHISQTTFCHLKNIRAIETPQLINNYKDYNLTQQFTRAAKECGSMQELAISMQNQASFFSNYFEKEIINSNIATLLKSNSNTLRIENSYDLTCFIVALLNATHTKIATDFEEYYQNKESYRKSSSHNDLREAELRLSAINIALDPA